MNYLWMVLFLLVSCGKKDHEDDIKKPDTPVSQDQGKAPPGPDSSRKAEPKPDEHPEEEDKPQEFSLDHQFDASEKTMKRYKDLATPGANLVTVKNWKTQKYIWVKITYKDSAGKEAYLYSACHLHGKNIGCHKKNDAGSEEPKETPASPDIPQ